MRNAQMTATWRWLSTWPWVASGVLAVLATTAIAIHWNDPMVTRECGYLGEVGRTLFDKLLRELLGTELFAKEICPAAWALEAPAVGLFVFTGAVLTFHRTPPCAMKWIAWGTVIVATGLITDRLSSQYATETANCHMIVLFVALTFGIAEGRRTEW